VSSAYDQTSGTLLTSLGRLGD